MKTKLINCGNYNCIHHYANSGTCSLYSISLDKDGKCVVFKEQSYKEIPIGHNEMDEHTNMC